MIGAFGDSVLVKRGEKNSGFIGNTIRNFFVGSSIGSLGLPIFAGIKFTSFGKSSNVNISNNNNRTRNRSRNRIRNNESSIFNEVMTQFLTSYLDPSYNVDSSFNNLHTC